MEDAFKAKVDALCTSWWGYAVNHQPPVRIAAPAAIPAADLPAVGQYFDSLPTSHELVKTMSALGVPTQGAGAWAALLTDFDAFDNALAAAIADAKVSDVSAWKTHISAVETTRGVMVGHLSDAGFRGNDQCQLVFRPNGEHE